MYIPEVRSVMKQCVDETTPLRTSDAPDFTVDCRGSDKCLAKIRHPISKVWVYLGTYGTPEEARDVCSRKKLEYESCSVQEEAASLRTNIVTDFEKHPGIYRLKKGKWGAVIRHNRSQVSLGRYDTPNEAAHAYNLSKLELESREISCSRKTGAVYSAESGMPKAANKRPLEAVTEQSEIHQRLCSVYQENIGENNEAVQVSLGRSYAPNEAVDAYNLSKPELDSQENGCSRKDSADYSTESGMPKAANKRPLEAAVEPSEKHQRPCCVYQEKIGEHKIDCLTNVICLESVGLEKDLQLHHVSSSSLKDGIGGRVTGTVYQDKSGKWKAEIQLRKVRHKLGTYPTAEDAREALNQKKCELGLKVEAEQNQRRHHAYPNKTGRWQTEIRHPITKARLHLGTFDTAEEAQEAYNNKRREFDMMFPATPGHKKRIQSNDSCDIGLKVDTEQSEKNQRRGHACLQKSGRWQSRIRNPITKTRMSLGTFDTAEEAEEAYNRKRREFEKCKQSNNSCDIGLKVDAEQSAKNQRRGHACLRKSGRWQSRMINPITKTRMSLGTFDTAEEAEEAYNRKRQEFEKHKQSNNSCDLGLNADADAEQSEKNKRRPHAYLRKSGRWTSEIRHPSAKDKKIYLGTFDTAEQAEEAYNSKRREFDLMFSGHKKRKQSNNSCKIDSVAEGNNDLACADPSVSAGAHSGTFTEEAEEAYNNKMREFDLMVSDHEKREQLKASCEADAIAEGRSDPNCTSEDPSVSANGSSVIKACMVNVNVESVPMLATGKSEEFDLGIIDSYGRLIGEYSRLDDELWICSSEDFVTLERDEGRIC